MLYEDTEVILGTLNKGQTYYFTVDSFNESGITKGTEVVVFGFQQQIELEDLVKADLYLTALGVYEAEINGEKVGNQIFAPGYTYYPRDLFYQKYDVRSMLNAGKSVLKVYVGQGWYCGRFTFQNKCQIYGEKQAVSWVLDWEKKNGEKGILTSRDNVDEISTPYQYVGFYDGEIYQEQGSGEKSGIAVEWMGMFRNNLKNPIPG